MKDKIANITKKLVERDMIWNFFWPFVKASNYIQYHRRVSQSIMDQQKVDDRIIKIINQPIVKHGPFKGLKYPSFKSYGSTLYPKLIGSYEAELHAVIERTCSKTYAVILDIGSAEGYYAVGLAMKHKGVPTYAFDIDETANIACSEMAVLNNVKDQIRVEYKCSAETLAKFDFNGKGLIVCDCEGYEKELFNEHNLANLKNCDLLIETHDFIDIDISDYLKSLFNKTHNITSIYSLDDIVKARSYQYPELVDLSLSDKREILAEKRPAIMEWLYLEPKL